MTPSTGSSATRTSQFSAGGVPLLFPRDPAGPAAETVNCGCQSLPWMESWEVKHPGRRPFSEEEIARNPIRAEVA